MFSIALRGGVILEELILRMSVILQSLQRFSVLGNTLFQEGNTGTVNFHYIISKSDILNKSDTTCDYRTLGNYGEMLRTSIHQDKETR